MQVADTNAGNGQIPDSPVGTPVDTAPYTTGAVDNPYLYTAYQIDTFNFASGQITPPLKVVIDSTPPAPPTKLVLDPSSDSGTSTVTTIHTITTLPSTPLLCSTSPGSSCTTRWCSFETV